MWTHLQPLVGSPWLALHCPHGNNNVQLVPPVLCGASFVRGATSRISTSSSCHLQQQCCTQPGWRTTATSAATAGCSSSSSSSSSGLTSSVLQHRSYSPALSVACHATAAPAAVPLPIEQHDPDPTKARLHALYRFVMDNGRVPKIHEQQEGVAVGFWAEQCRQQHQLQQLDSDLAAALQSVHGWNWQPQTRALSVGFEEGIRFVQQYQAVHRGRLPKTRTNKKSSNTELEAQATAVCRQLMEQRRRGVLTQQQIDHVSAALHGWRWDARVRAPPLDIMLQLLQDFVQRQGRLPRQHERLPDGFLLGEWCAARRGEYAHGQLETDVAEAISNGVPGWCWNLGDTAFEHNLEVLHQFVAQEQRIPAQREEHCGVRIGAWCNKRRLQYKQGSMPPDRVAALEAVDGWWWSAEDMPEG